MKIYMVSLFHRATIK